jgi:hypothetical protein
VPETALNVWFEQFVGDLEHFKKKKSSKLTFLDNFSQKLFISRLKTILGDRWTLYGFFFNVTAKQCESITF